MRHTSDTRQKLLKQGTQGKKENVDRQETRKVHNHGVLKIRYIKELYEKHITVKKSFVSSKYLQARSSGQCLFIAETTTM